MTIQLFQIDAFANTTFQGNPAAVCILKKKLSGRLMQNIAAENNVSETAFILPITKGFSLKWFTPKVEVPLCGHATLASAHVLWEEGILGPGERAHFHTLSGLLTASRKNNWIEIDLPALQNRPARMPAQMRKALGVKPIHTTIAEGHYIVEVANEKEIRKAKPDISSLANYESVIITCKAPERSPFDIISRYFAPSYGVNEDPVTGSAHCCLAPYWSAKLGKDDLHAYQASARGGELKLRLHGNRVLISGKAVTVFKGNLFV